MPEQKEMPLSDLELVYLNGQEHGGAPVFKDVRLSRDSQTICDQLEKLAEGYNKRIRNESESIQCQDLIGQLRDGIKKLDYLEQQERKPWVHILSQISTGIDLIRAKFRTLEAQLKARLEAWRTEVAEGQQRQFEKLQAQAHELEQKARYASDPQVSRQAKVKAKEVHKEARSFQKLKPMPGTATVVRYEFEIENRLLAAKLSEEAVTMECRPHWFEQKIKEAKHLGQGIPTWPGIRVTTRTEVRLPR